MPSRGLATGGVVVPGKGGGYAYSVFRIADLSGGVNLRDAATELAPNESPDLWNMVIDERGGATKRLGYIPWNASAAANPMSAGYDSRLVDLTFWYSRDDGKLYTDPGTGILTLRHTFTSGENVSMADFVDRVYLIHPNDGLWESSDGSAWSATVATGGAIPTGQLCAVWQNKLWIADGNTVNFSKAGDATNWDTAAGAGANKLREGRDSEAPITAMLGSTTFDTQLRPSLMVFKDRSFHVVTDSSTGAYLTLDQFEGAPNQHAVTAQYGRIFVTNPRGVFQTDGLSPLVPLSGKLDKLFRLQVNQSATDDISCVGHQGTVRGTLRLLDGDLVSFRYHPLFESFTLGDDVGRVYLSKDRRLLASDPASGRIYQMDTGGADNGVAIDSRMKTRIFEPFQSVAARCQKMTIRIGGSVGMKVLTDFSPDGTLVSLATATASGFKWDLDSWGSLWGAGDVIEDYVYDYPRLEGQAFQLSFSESSSNVRSVPSEQGTLQVGAWAIYGAEIAFNQLSVI
jgi:hypothetical protein